MTWCTTTDVILQPDDEAYVGPLNYNGTEWDAVFILRRDGKRELKALMADPAMAAFVAQALNDTRTSAKLRIA